MTRLPPHMLLLIGSCLLLPTTLAPFPAQQARGADIVEQADPGDPTGSGDPAHQTADWPRWRGPEGSGRWLPPAPLKPLGQSVKRIWQQPLGPGYSGIAVAEGRVYTQDRQPAAATDGDEAASARPGTADPGTSDATNKPQPKIVQERVVCHDAQSGKLLWQYQYTADYQELDYDKGPRATPLVDDGRVYCLGAVGKFLCLDAHTGKLLFQKDLKEDFGGRQPMWGFAASPIRYRDAIILHPGAADGCFVALDRTTGQLLWRGGSDSCGYATPIVVQHAGRPLLVGWTPEHVVGLSPDTGRQLWSIDYPVTYGVSIASPIFQQGIVLVAGYWEGSKAIRLGQSPDQADLIWEENRQLRGLMSEPLYRDGHIYLLDKQHGIVCAELATGRILWTDDHQLTPAGRNPQASLVWVGHTDQALALNSEGQLVLACLRPDGFQELGRMQIVGPTWAHPAYAGTMVFARDDEQLTCWQLAE